MSACEVQFMGGPADGKFQVVPGDEPPPQLVVATSPPAWDQPPGEFRYVRQVSQMDDGPLWVYVPEMDQP